MGTLSVEAVLSFTYLNELAGISPLVIIAIFLHHRFIKAVGMKP